MNATPKTRLIGDTTFTWQTLKGVGPGARLATRLGDPNALAYDRSNLGGYLTIESMRFTGQTRMIKFAGIAKERRLGGVATKFWVAPPETNWNAAPKTPASAPAKTPRAARIPADASTFVCTACHTDKPITAYPTVTGPQDRTTTCRACRTATRAA
jgi:hypothetical protein